MEIHPFALQQGPYGIPQGNIGIVSINPAQFNNVGEEYEEGEYINENYGYEEGGYDLVPGHLGQKQNMDNQADYDRERDRDRSRRRDRDGRRRDDRRSSHERDRNRRRDRDRDRDRDRGRDRRDRERSSHRSSDDDRDSDSRDSFHRSDQREDRAGEKWMTDTPTNTVLLRNLPPQVEEKDIRAELMMFGAPVRDVRLMRRSTGTSRGFAFVEFQSVADAQRWMDHYQGVLNIQNHYSATMHYSTPKTQPDKGPIHKTDWTCSKCGVHNFKRRDHCFKCNLSREESERKQEGDGFDQVGTNPCNTLILRGLDALTTEDNILHVMSQISTFPLKNVQIIRDEATNTSKGFGFMELNTVNEAHQLLDQFNNRAPLEVDGKQLLVNYAKNTFSTVMATLTAAANQFGTTQDQSWGAYNPSAAVAAAQQQGYYDQSYYQGADYSQQQGAYNQYYEGTQTDSTNAAAAVAQAAINKKLASKGNPQQKKGQTKEPPQVPTPEQIASQEYAKYPPPDVSTYQYEETSGYYYDPLTTLYYDANSQYYYNAQTGQFLYWDAEKSTYLPAPTNQQQGAGIGATEGEAPTEKKKKEEKKEKNKMAKKIAKDMEKWAQSMNKQKEAMKGFNAALKAMNPNDRKESATADAGYAILEKSAKGGLEDKKLMPPPSVATSSPSRGAAAAGGGGKPGLVASYGGDSDEEEAGGEEDSGILDESKLTDWNKLACLLCKRQFQTKEILIKHQQMSDLHKQNLENLIKAKASAGGSDSGQFQYRDRAKERRDKYGIPPPPEPRQKRPDLPVPYEQPTKSGIGGDNIGNKLLQKMGWQAGKGLGKSGQGIVNPIEAERRAQAAGLGMRGSNYGTTTGDDYRESVKKTMFARYHEIDS